MSKNLSVILKRIIAVNSAGFAYVEVPLDDNLVILGHGNLGKTSVVNAVRFFLLPEVNLKNSDQKFGFLAGKGESATYFTKEQNYNHYFPTDDSRLILEVEHLLLGGGKQVHCQIISRGNDFGIKRCFIPEPYNVIEHLFWDKNEKEAGSRPKVLPGQKLLTELNKINSKTKQYSQYEQLTEALYAANTLRPDTFPFVIFPLKDTKPSSIASLRALVLMLFNQDERSLRLMTATAIEMMDKKDNKLSLDVDAIITEQADLRRRREHLDLFRSHEPAFLRLKDQYQLLSQQKTTEQQFVTLYANVQAYSEKNNKVLHQLASAFDAKRNERGSAKAAEDRNGKDIYHVKQRITELNSEITKLNGFIEKASLVISAYPNMPTSEIIEIHKDDLSEKQSKLEAHQDAGKKRQLIQRHKDDISIKQKELERLTERLEKDEFSLMRQLDENTICTLAAINKKLSDANPKRKLSQIEIDYLKQFAQLFKRSGDEVHFFDSTFAFFTNLTTDNYAVRIEDLSAEIKDLNARINQFSDLDNQDGFAVAREVEKIRKQIEGGQSDLNLLEKFDYNKQNVEEKKAQIVECQQKLDTLTRDAQALKSNVQRLSDEVNALGSDRERLLALEKEVSAILSRFQLEVRFPSLNADLHDIAIDPQFAFSQVHADELLRLAASLEKIKGAKDEVKAGLTEMVLLKLIIDDYGYLQGNKDDDTVFKMFDALLHRYDLLGEDNKVLDRDIRTHNEHVRNRLERLEKTRQRIEYFVNDVNRGLSDAVINDLEAVRLTVGLHPYFEDLVNSWREYDDLGSDSALPEHWYDRLRDFMSSDAVNQTDKILRLENVIKSAGYEIQKQNKLWDSKPQSNSTKMLINTHLCEIFIQRLSDSENAEVQFPVIMDEIGSVSSEQFPKLIKDLNEKGQKLIGVTVHGKSGDVITAFQNVLIMDELLTSEPYTKQHRNVCFSRDIESVTTKIVKQDTLFEDES